MTDSQSRILNGPAPGAISTSQMKLLWESLLPSRSVCSFVLSHRLGASKWDELRELVFTLEVAPSPKLSRTISDLIDELEGRVHPLGGVPRGNYSKATKSGAEGTGNG